MSITRLKNIYTSNTGRILYVSPDDFDASDSISNRGNSPLRPFKTIQRAFLEAARFSYVPGNGGNNDRFDQFTIMLMPGEHVVDNRPGISDPTQTPILNENSNFDVQDSNNVLYKFNSTRGGIIVPRGTSLVGVDLRKTKIIPKFIPNPALSNQGSIQINYPSTGVTTGTGNSSELVLTSIEDDTRSAVFRVTGGCYFWQFTFFDGDENGVYTGAPNPTGVPTTLVPPYFSHHKLTNFEYACLYDLSIYYQKITRAFSSIGFSTSDPLGPRIEENRIVGPGGIQADILRIKQITYNDRIATATVVEDDDVTPRAHGFSVGSQVRVFNSNDAVTGVTYNGSYIILAIGSSQNNNVVDQFTYQLSGTPNQNATDISDAQQMGCEIESDTVDSASPYIFNISIRSVYGICGMHANGAMATGFKSMVVAQYTGICLQKDDRAFVRACPRGSSNYQAGTIKTCNSTPYINDRPAHQDIDSQYAKGWRNYHIKASNDSYIQVVSVFAVGFADQFIVESGGDMSIANSDSNFGNTALRAKGFKADAFIKDKYGYISHIIPPANLPTTLQTINWLPFDIQKTRNNNPDNTKIFIYGADSQSEVPNINVLGYTVGAKVNDTLYVTLGNTIATAVVEPSGPQTKTVEIGSSGSPIKWDSSANNWYISVDPDSTIVSTLKNEFQYSSPSQITTSISSFKRINDSRLPDDKIYRLRLVIPNTAINASPPQTGFVLQPLNSNNNYKNTYYIFNVETYQPLIYNTQDGIYYLTVLIGNISPTVSNFDDTKFSQNVNQLYPTEDIDNPVADPQASKSIADNITIGLVVTTNGDNTSPVTDRSITREAIIGWCKESSNPYTISDNSQTYNYWNSSYAITVNGNTLTSKTGAVESRIIDVPNTNIELRRPSIIRAGNQTFEYTGFGPGNYSTGFPSKQTIILTDEQVKLSQSKRENGGISFYSGLNANGDLYVGNTVINPVTGTTTSVNNPTSSSATDPNSPVFNNATVTKAITVIGDSGNNAISNFYGPLSVYGEASILNSLKINPIWDTVSTKFTSVDVNVTDTASASTSNLIDLRVNNSSKFSVDKNGNVNITGTINGVTGIASNARSAISVSNFGNAGTGLSYNSSTGVITYGRPTLEQVISAGNGTTNTIRINNSTGSTTTTTGALVVSGGVGVSGTLNIGGGISAGSTIIAPRGVFTNLTVTGSYGNIGADSIKTAGVGITGTGITGSSLTISGTGGTTTISGSSGTITSPRVVITGTTSSTSTTTGALVVSGGVGVGGTLNVGGDIVAFASSDIRLKTNITQIKNSLDKIVHLSGNTFTWNEKSSFNGQNDIGVIAQEVEEVLPEIVVTRESGYKAVRYEKIVALLIEGIKELNERVKILENNK